MVATLRVIVDRFATSLGRERRRAASTLRVAITGGPHDGGVLEVPRRTPAGLRLSLESDTGTAEYELVSGRDGLQVIPCVRAASTRVPATR